MTVTITYARKPYAGMTDTYAAANKNEADRIAKSLRRWKRSAEGDSHATVSINPDD